MVAPAELVPEAWPELWPLGLRAVAMGHHLSRLVVESARCKRLHPPVHTAQLPQAAQDPFVRLRTNSDRRRAELPCRTAAPAVGSRDRRMPSRGARGTAYVLGRSALHEADHVAVGVGEDGHGAPAADVRGLLLDGGAGPDEGLDGGLEVVDRPVGRAARQALAVAVRVEGDLLAVDVVADVVGLVGV